MNKFEIRYNSEIEKFGERLREIRESKGMTQLDLEVSSGINRTEISRIENGQKNIEFMTLTRLATALEVELEKFFTHKS
ncbi:MAG: helix-turn-helix domain-containing protein [Agriterribacter sp.]